MTEPQQQPAGKRECDTCKGPLGIGAIVLKRVAHCSKCRLDKPNQFGEAPEYGSIGAYWDEPVLPDPQERGGATGSSHSGTRIIEVPEDELRTLANERLALLAQLAERKARSQELTTVKESLFRISTDLSAQVEAMRGALSAIKYLNLDHKPADEAIALMRSWASDGLVALDGQAQPQPDVASPTDS